VATSSAQLGHAAIQEQALEVTRRLLTELGNDRAAAQLQPGSHLERDLGLGSLERVELILRLNSACGVNLPDQVVGEAETLEHLVAAIARDEGAAATAAPPRAAAPPAAFASAAPNPDSAETMLDVLRYRGRADARRLHIVLREADDGERTITFGELFEGARSVAQGLELRGIEAGQTVAIMLPTCAEFFTTFFGVMLAGGIPVPIYPPFRADRIEEYAARQAAILNNAEARLLVTFRRAERVARLLKPQVRSLAAVVDAARLPAPDAPQGVAVSRQTRGDDIAFLQYTSGSTGAPKGVEVTHANLLANLRAIGQGIEVSPNDVVVSWLPLYHDMGLIGAWFVPLYFGLRLVAMSPLAFLSRPQRWLRAIHEQRGTITAAPNFAYELCVRKIADRDLEGLDLSSMRAMLNGSEPVLPETLERFTARFARYGLRPEAVLPVYGLAEATLAVSAAPFGRLPRVDRIDRGVFENEGCAMPAAVGDSRALEFVSAGTPIPTCEVRIAGADGAEMGERVEGQLWLGGPSAARGYYRNPQATAAILREGGWIDSGDRAYLAEGELFITGRSKDIIIKGGRNLYPHEVEGIASQVAGVRKGCVVAFGVTDARVGTERLVVVAEIREPSDGPRIETEMVRRITDALGLPPDIVKLLPPQSILKTSSGKLRRDETRQLYLAGKLGVRRPPLWLQVARLAARGAAARIPGSTGGLARRALQKIYGVYALGVFAAWLVPTSLLVRLAPSHRAAARFTRYSCRTLLAVLGCRLRIEGREHLHAATPGVLAVNHTSYLDVVVLLAALPVDYRFSTKIEVRSWPLVGAIVRKLGQLSFDRSDPHARLRQVEQIEETLRGGKSVLVFPEGTFTPAAGIRAFQLGAFKAAAATGRPICPLALRGAREILRDGTLLPRPGRVTLTMCPPVAPAGSDWREIARLRDATRLAISRHSGEPLL
jgi:fatty-acyl-CoA synthase